MAAYWNRKQVTPGEVAYAGVIAGILAGIAMAIVSMGWAMMTGRGAWTPVKMIAVTVLNRSWLDRPGFQFTPVMVGMIIHFATAIGFGIIFSLIGGRLSYGQAISWGIVYGLGIWLFMQFLWLPMVNPVMAQMPSLPFAIEHAIFGGFLGTYPAFLGSRAETQIGRERERLAA